MSDSNAQNQEDPEVIVGSDEADEIHAAGGVDVVMGEGGDDTLYGGDSTDYLFGGSGDDTIEGGADGDVILGGSGNDTLRGEAGSDFVLGGSGDDTLEGGAETDLLSGGSGDDTISGGEGADLIFGGAGDDTIDGGDGGDLILGESGDDTLTGGAGGDIFAFGPDSGSDTITDFDTDEDTIDLSPFGANVSYSDLTIAATTDGTGTIITIPGPDGGAPVTITLQGVTSSAVSESMFTFSNAGAGTAADEFIFDVPGDSTMTGGGGRDIFVFAPGSGDDTITDFDTSDDIIDLMGFGTGVDFDSLTLAATADGTGTVITLPGDDGGTITLLGVSVNDVTADMFQFDMEPIRGVLDIDGEADSETSGTRFDDTLIGAEGDDRIDGGGGDDWIFGNEGDDTLQGGEGDDVILGGQGADTIDGGAGSNVVFGGAGADTFVVRPGQTETTIADFSDGVDHIDLRNISGITELSDLTIADDNGTAIIDLSAQGGGTIRLTDVAVADLDAEDFVFAGSTSMVDAGL